MKSIYCGECDKWYDSQDNTCPKCGNLDCPESGDDSQRNPNL